MKVFYLIALFSAGWVFMLPAQTNTSTNGVAALLALVSTNAPTASTSTNHAPAPESTTTTIQIDAVGPANFNPGEHWMTYQDHVRVTDPEMKLTCEWIRANLPQGGDRITNIVAETNIVINFTDQKGQKTHATGVKLVYFFHVENGVTNETFTLTGTPEKRPQIQQAGNTMTGDKIWWDGANGQLHVEGNPEVIGVYNNKPPGGTNSAATNNLSVPKFP
jgi:lipopolysaccharide export system protein LptA